MGLFWADEQTKPVQPQQKSNGTYYDWLWAQPVERKFEASIPKPSKCPVDHTKLQQKSKCPVDHNKLNPQNMMPELTQSQVPGQRIALPTERTTSSIPKGTTQDNGNWEYPSPQQMLNAMVRKTGPEGIEEDAVESMVDVHNFLNEGVWNEVLDWETKYTQESKISPRLLQFQGRPQDITPRAQMIQWLGKLFPETWGCPPPFDRHDWTVLRSDGQGVWKKVRYVIDFYEAPDDGDMPAFSVDVRPAVDNFENVKDRILKSAMPVWSKAMGK